MIIMCTYIYFFLISFLINIIFFLNITLLIATITLIERKVMALVQRRVGPNYIGYKGRFQFIADALKLLLKQIILLNNINRILFLLFPVFALIMCYLFWLNIIWAPSLAICEIEYNLLFMSLLSVLFSFLLFLVSWYSQNKYSILSGGRVIILTTVLEIFLNFFIIFLLLLFESFSFYQIVSYQTPPTYGIFLLAPLLPVLIVVFLLETGRIPFDLAEAESELIAGYTTELGGFFFALFYLGEYFHLYCFSIVYSLCLLGGWH